MWTRAMFGLVVCASFVSDAWSLVRSALPSSGREVDVSFKPSGLTCSGTAARERLTQSHMWFAANWPDEFDIEEKDQSVPALEPHEGCGRETRARLLRSSKDGMFRKTAKCVVCPHCDFGIET